jgi:hypothetical protein
MTVMWPCSNGNFLKLLHNAKFIHVSGLGYLHTFNIYFVVFVSISSPTPISVVCVRIEHVYFEVGMNDSARRLGLMAY